MCASLSAGLVASSRIWLLRGARSGAVARRAGSSVAETKAETKAVADAPTAEEFASFLPPLALFLLSDKALNYFLVSHGVTFPSPLVGLFLIFGSLVVLDTVDQERCSSVVGFFDPAVGFIARWLPLFYVPPLVTLPLAVQSLTAEQIGKLLLIVVPGFVASLWFTGLAVKAIRSVTNTELLPYEVKPPMPSFSPVVLQAWATVAVAGTALVAIAPAALGSVAMTAVPLLLSNTIMGLIIGSELPVELRRVLHPIITCTLFGEAATAIYSFATGTPFLDVLRIFTTKDLFHNPGAGDLFMSFLGSVILSFAFSMFKQRALIQRHYREIFGGVLLSAMFSLFATAAAGNLLGLGPQLTLSVVPRSVTVALAMPTAQMLGVDDVSITAAAVVLTGLIGANFVQTLLDLFGYKDPIVRGISTAGSSHGLGTAALAAKEPEALSFCAISYAMTGIATSLLVAVPAVRDALLVLAGSAAIT